MELWSLYTTKNKDRRKTKHYLTLFPETNEILLKTTTLSKTQKIIGIEELNLNLIKLKKMTMRTRSIVKDEMKN